LLSPASGTVAPGRAPGAVALRQAAGGAPPSEYVRRFPHPVDGGEFNVTAVSGHDAWVAGYTEDTDPLGLILHWNGTNWSVAATPNPPSAYLCFPGGVYATSRRNAWAVGSTDWAVTPIEHWNGKSWSD
jgi:hypothetical protein